jgi:hypothetical protein
MKDTHGGGRVFVKKAASGRGLLVHTMNTVGEEKCYRVYFEAMRAGSWQNRGNRRRGCACRKWTQGRGGRFTVGALECADLSGYSTPVVTAPVPVVGYRPRYVRYYYAPASYVYP